MGRLLAVEAFEKKKDRKSVDALGQTLRVDPFFGVRVAAAGALRKIHTPEALEALLASTRQDDARVRRAVAGALADYYEPQARDSLLQLAEREQNPAVIAAALPGLARWEGDSIRNRLLTAARGDSFRQTEVEGAFSAMRTHGSPLLVAPLRELLEQRAGELRERAFNRGLETLAFLARNETERGPVREWITTRVHHPRPSTREAAIRALGTLGDPLAIRVLETFAGADEGAPYQKAASEAVRKLMAAKETAPELKDLRRELTDLKRDNESLRKEFEQFRRQQRAIQGDDPKADPQPRP